MKLLATAVAECADSGLFRKRGSRAGKPARDNDNNLEGENSFNRIWPALAQGTQHG